MPTRMCGEEMKPVVGVHAQQRLHGRGNAQARNSLRFHELEEYEKFVLLLFEHVQRLRESRTRLWFEARHRFHFQPVWRLHRLGDPAS